MKKILKIRVEINKIEESNRENQRNQVSSLKISTKMTKNIQTKKKRREDPNY